MKRGNSTKKATDAENNAVRESETIQKNGVHTKNPEKIIIGPLIRQKMQEEGLTVTQLAEALSCDRTNIYKIFKKDSIDLVILIKLSNLLNYNFLSDYYQDHKRLVIIETSTRKISQLQKDKSLKIIYIH